MPVALQEGEARPPVARERDSRISSKGRKTVPGKIITRPGHFEQGENKASVSWLERSVQGRTHKWA